MSRARVAPTRLEKFIALETKLYSDKEFAASVRDQFRAMQDVVRAAEWWVEADMKFEPGTPAGNLHAAMTRLARLSRVSRNGRGAGEGR